MEYKDAIKELRKRMLVSQSELAEILGVSFATVNRWEQGLHQPTYKAKRKLRNLFSKNKIITEE
ncbi:helix-turn-helix domain-containing protein [bacterium]|nr:helix-turn-helix domain-containing protein [bacterium]